MNRKTHPPTHSSLILSPSHLSNLLSKFSLAHFTSTNLASLISLSHLSISVYVREVRDCGGERWWNLHLWLNWCWHRAVKENTKTRGLRCFDTYTYKAHDKPESILDLNGKWPLEIHTPIAINIWGGFFSHCQRRRSSIFPGGQKSDLVMSKTSLHWKIKCHNQKANTCIYK